MSALLLLLVATSFAGEPRLSVSAERSLATGVEQNALVFEGGRATLALSSNFLASPPGSSARLGLYRSKMTDALETERVVLKNAAARAERAAKREGLDVEPGRGPHETLWRLNQARLKAPSSGYSDARQALSRAWELGEWKPEDAAQVTIGPDRTVTVRREGGKLDGKVTRSKLEKACEPLGRAAGGYEKWVCAVEGLGRAYLSPPGGSR